MAKKNGAGTRKDYSDSRHVPVPKRVRSRFYFDRRTVAARRWAALFSEYFEATGHKHPQLCATAASLASERERFDHMLASGATLGSKDRDQLIRLSSALARTLRTLGLTHKEPSSIAQLLDEVRP